MIKLGSEPVYSWHFAKEDWVAAMSAAFSLGYDDGFAKRAPLSSLQLGRELLIYSLSRVHNSALRKIYGAGYAIAKDLLAKVSEE